MAHERNFSVVCTAHTQQLASRFGRRSRRIAEISGVPLSRERSAVDDWETEDGCRYRSVGVGGAIIGDGFHLLIVDDPHKNREEAESDTQRENVWEWFTQDLYGRQEPGAAIIVIMSRWHEDDLVGRLLTEFPDEWTVVDLPALALENDPLGRVPGQALCPDRYNEAALADRKRVHGEYHFLGQYQQRPTAKEGIFFKIANLEIVDALPAGMTLVRAWDKAASEGEGDWTVGVKMGRHGDTYYVVDVVRGQWSTDNRDKMIRLTAALDGQDVQILGPQDPGDAGKSSAEAFIKNLAGYSVKTARVSGSKDVRADPLSSQVNASNVRLLKGAWNKPYTEEFRQFPLGKWDDQVDASSDAFNFLALMDDIAFDDMETQTMEEIQVPQTEQNSSGQVRNGMLFISDQKPPSYLDSLRSPW